MADEPTVPPTQAEWRAFVERLRRLASPLATSAETPRDELVQRVALVAHERRLDITAKPDAYWRRALVNVRTDLQRATQRRRRLQAELAQGRRSAFRATSDDGQHGDDSVDGEHGEDAVNLSDRHGAAQPPVEADVPLGEHAPGADDALVGAPDREPTVEERECFDALCSWVRLRIPRGPQASHEGQRATFDQLVALTFRKTTVAALVDAELADEAARGTTTAELSRKTVTNRVHKRHSQARRRLGELLERCCGGDTSDEPQLDPPPGGWRDYDLDAEEPPGGCYTMKRMVTYLQSRTAVGAQLPSAGGAAADPSDPDGGGV